MGICYCWIYSLKEYHDCRFTYKSAPECLCVCVKFSLKYDTISEKFTNFQKSEKFPKIWTISENMKKIVKIWKISENLNFIS